MKAARCRSSPQAPEVHTRVREVLRTSYLALRHYPPRASPIHPLPQVNYNISFGYLFIICIIWRLGCELRSMLSSRSWALILGRTGNTSQLTWRSISIASSTRLGTSSNLRHSIPVISRQLAAAHSPGRIVRTRTSLPAYSRRNSRRRYTTQPAKQSFTEDTIYAVSTAQGRAGIAIIRISGPACLDVGSLTVSTYFLTF